MDFACSMDELELDLEDDEDDEEDDVLESDDDGSSGGSTWSYCKIDVMSSISDNKFVLSSN